MSKKARKGIRKMIMMISKGEKNILEQYPKSQIRAIKYYQFIGIFERIVELVLYIRDTCLGHLKW